MLRPEPACLFAQEKSLDMRGNKDYLESAWVASEEEADKVIASYQEQYEAATGGDGASGNGAAAPKKAGDASAVKAKDLKGSLRFTVCTSFGMGLKARYPAPKCTLFCSQGLESLRGSAAVHRLLPRSPQYCAVNAAWRLSVSWPSVPQERRQQLLRWKCKAIFLARPAVQDGGAAALLRRRRRRRVGGYGHGCHHRHLRRPLPRRLSPQARPLVPPGTTTSSQIIRQALFQQHASTAVRKASCGSAESALPTCWLAI